MTQQRSNIRGNYGACLSPLRSAVAGRHNDIVDFLKERAIPEDVGEAIRVGNRDALALLKGHTEPSQSLCADETTAIVALEKIPDVSPARSSADDPRAGWPPQRRARLRLFEERGGRAAGPRKRRPNFRAVLQATGARVFATLVIGGALACGDSSRRSSSTDAGVADTNVFAPDTQPLNDAARDAPEPQDSAIPDVSVDAGAATTNRLRNGSFETWTMAESPNTTPDDWSNCTTGAFGIGVDAAPELCDGELTPMSAFDGVRWARSWSREGVEQSVPTTPGARYRLTFAYCGMISCLGGGTSSEWVVNVDGEELGRTPDVEDTEWRVAEFEFTAADTDSTICLRNGGAQSGIDAVSLVEL